jgi:hypothetical protein
VYENLIMDADRVSADSINYVMSGKVWQEEFTAKHNVDAKALFYKNVDKLRPAVRYEPIREDFHKRFPGASNDDLCGWLTLNRKICAVIVGHKSVVVTNGGNTFWTTDDIRAALRLRNPTTYHELQELGFEQEGNPDGDTLQG